MRRGLAKILGQFAAPIRVVYTLAVTGFLPWRAGVHIREARKGVFSGPVRTFFSTASLYVAAIFTAAPEIIGEWWGTITSKVFNIYHTSDIGFLHDSPRARFSEIPGLTQQIFCHGERRGLSSLCLASCQRCLCLVTSGSFVRNGQVSAWPVPAETVGDVRRGCRLHMGVDRPRHCSVQSALDGVVQGPCRAFARPPRGLWVGLVPPKPGASAMNVLLRTSTLR